MQQENNHRKIGKSLDLISNYLIQQELLKQKAIWSAFGMDYEAEKAKQEVIWKQFQARKKKRKKLPLKKMASKK